LDPHSVWCQSFLTRGDRQAVLVAEREGRKAPLPLLFSDPAGRILLGTAEDYDAVIFCVPAVLFLDPCPRSSVNI